MVPLVARKTAVGSYIVGAIVAMLDWPDGGESLPDPKFTHDMRAA